MTHDPAVAELLSFFDYAHLPPHLAEASRPFHKAAHALAIALTGPGEPETEPFTRMAFALVEDLEDGSTEAREAAAKVALVIREGATTGVHAWRQSLGRWLRLLLEAKDCAVRAALVRAREQPAEQAKTVAVEHLPGLLAGIERLREGMTAAGLLDSPFDGPAWTPAGVTEGVRRSVAWLRDHGQHALGAVQVQLGNRQALAPAHQLQPGLRHRRRLP